MGDESMKRAGAAAMAGAATKRIGPEELARARLLHKRCVDGKARLDDRVIDGETWFRLRHDPYAEGVSREQVEKRPFRTTSGWLFNTVANKHADAMDNYPRPNLLPREAGDEAEAELLSAVIPAQLQRLNFEKTYSDIQWDKLKYGVAVYGVFWDGAADNGLGEVSIRAIDILSLSWDPGVRELQESRNVFLSTTHDREAMMERYPALAHELGAASAYDVSAKKEHDTDDDTRRDTKVEVVDWYYKRWQGGREVLHLCQYCGSVILYATENDPALAEVGLYDHGKFPFVLDVLYPIKGSPAGFGMIDICRNPQMYVDLLDAAILENAQQGAKPRYFFPAGLQVNKKDYLNMDNQLVEYGGVSGDGIIPIETKPLDGIYMSVLEHKVSELKEISGNRDATTGGTVSGVTAASAIAAMVETGSKLTRDSSRGSYRAFREVVELDVELIRQFYTLPHKFRVVGAEGTADYASYDGTGLTVSLGADAETGEERFRRVAFDIEITAERSSPYARITQNELMLQLYGAGFFTPGNADASLAAIEGMAFDQKEPVRRRIRENGTLFEVNRQLMATNQALAEQMAAAVPGAGAVSEAVAAQNAEQMAAMEAVSGEAAPDGGVSLSGTASAEEPAHMKRTRQQVADSTAPM